MLQLVYISSPTPTGATDTISILATSCSNNARDGITGLLYSDGVRFLQALEGPEESVEAAFQRISRDPRHKAIVVLSRRSVSSREFGNWDMAQRRPGADSATFLARVEALTRGASAGVRATFEGLARLERAA